MTSFNITAADLSITEKLLLKINNKTKPIGALGDLEGLAIKIGIIQQSTSPQLNKPTILVFAADHGIAKDNEVNAYPQEVTAQMVYNFLNGGAAINVFCKQNNLDLKIIDAGVNHNFGVLPNLIDAKIDYGTKNVLQSPAMTIDQYHQAIKKGAELVTHEFNKGCNVVGFGEMGIGNTSAAALLMAALTNIYIEDCVGAGAGLNKDQILRKSELLGKVLDTHFPYTLPDIMATFGGFEIAMIAGGILKAAELKMTVLIDGFIVTSALLFAHAMNENVLDYCIICHQSEEQGHQKMIDYLEKKTILNLGLRLGEGTGVALAYPLITAAVNFLNEMASFESAGVSK
ncbi:nicotinate-nucleotide--dimethylbenzimidazole phosphoribosyltransferase [Aquimarina agarivorans]|uniref:nicotinate-nucleotide--dimethylbenzimidazole phosphoribosyltransferase n=1 Tax=Aquimarina agarivorans TaxID=980584 RepID=UPI000248F8AF|nr:nicotinate-nucleotide--dimethylbenzimidazole phosphoribosyltransferase [Aquimarina agarivorans]